MTRAQEAKETLRAVCPDWLLSVWHPLRSAYWGLRHRSKSPASIFAEIHDKRLWGNGESVSGLGSDLAQTAAVRKALPLLLKQLGARVLVDAPCGDFYWMKEVDLPLERYLGLDIVPALIAHNQTLYADRVREFRVHSITEEPLPTCDVILCRDCLVHLANLDITRAIQNFKKSGSEYLLTTTFTGQRENRDIVTGEWRPLNLQGPPWNFPEPLTTIDEECTLGHGSCRDKVLALWRISDLPA